VIRLHIRNLQKKLPVDRPLLKKIVQTVCAQESPGVEFEITLCLVTDEVIRRLNCRFHHSDCATDVLAFPLSQGAQEIIADVFVSADTAVSQSKAYKTNPRYEMSLYVVHGLLHITGYDDLTSADRAVMRRKEKEFLKILHIK
jgi:probable rRNA maturation factor